MLGEDPIVTSPSIFLQHYLSVDLKAREVRQKCRSFSAEKNATIILEVDCLLVVGFK